MSPHNPDYVDPLTLSERGQSVTGTYELRELSRLRSVLLDAAGEAAFEFRFSRDDSRRPLIEGRVTTTLNLLCQRCLEPLALPVDAEFALVLVQGFDEAEVLPEEFEPLMPEDSVVSLRDLVEEELLLAIPTVPKHESCDLQISIAAASDDEIELDESPRENPFQVLAALKKIELDD